MGSAARLWSAGLVVAIIVGPVALWAAEHLNSETRSVAPKHEQVELFAAQQSGELEVVYVARDAFHGRLIVANHSGRPLSVLLPEAFAAAPVLAQFNNRGPLNGVNPQTQQAQQSPQSVGTGTAPGGANRNVNFFNNANPPNRAGNNGLQGFFNIAPEKTVTLRLDTLCLEHGKATPRPTQTYQLQPLEVVNSRPAVRELLKQYAASGHDRLAAQAAAWHLANDMTWKQLADKRLPSANNQSEAYFTRRQIDDAKKLVVAAEKAAAETPPSPSVSKIATSVATSQK